jgi:DEAD/DEAH box helicase domain-containing protein
MPRVLFFDLETRLLADDLNPNDNSAGWEALRNGEGGISALAIYDSMLNWCYVYDDHSIHSAVLHLEKADAVVGFASKSFDVPVIEGIIGRKLALNYHYDILEESARAYALVGGKRVKGDFTLDSVCKRTIGRGKIDHGSRAKQMTAEGRFGELFNYCLDDVHLTHDLFQFIRQNNGIVRPDKGFLYLTLPSWLEAKSQLPQEKDDN